MAKFTLEDTIKTFTFHQALVVYWFCEGLSNENIAARFGYEKSWVVWQMSFVYYKLGLDRPDTNGRKLHWNTRRDILREKVCPILRKLINDDPELLERFPLIPPNVFAESIVDLRPEIPVPPLDHPIPLPEPPSEPPPLPPKGQNPPPEPPPDFYPIELYNAWLAVLEDDEPKVNHEPGHQPIIIPPVRRGIIWGRIIVLGLGILLGCAAVGVLAYWLGSHNFFTPATATSVPIIQPTSTLEPSPTIQLTDTETPLPTDTLIPSPTFTPTFTLTPLPTDTKSPIGLVKGDSLSDNRVTLKFKEIRYEQGRTRVGQRPIAPIVFLFDFTNNSGDTILVQLDQDEFRAEDNLGNKLTCEFWNGVVETTATLQYPLGNQQTVGISVFCGEGKIPSSVTVYTLYITNFSSLPDSTWIAQVAR